MTPNGKPRLSYYSFDSLGNPWVSGGGAVRDFEVLKRIARNADVTLYTARYPGFKDRTEDGVRIRGLGFGNRNWLCRLMYTLHANCRILFDRADSIVNGASIYAPILLGALRGNRYSIFLHHYIGKESLRKYGIAGLLPWICESILMRSARRYLVVNASVKNRIRAINPRAEILQTANGFDAGLLSSPRNPSIEPFVLFLGRFDMHMKGLDLLIPAWANVLAPRNIDLVLAGRGTDADVKRLTDMVPASGRDKFRLEMDITERRKRELLSACLFFASPSRFEGFGIAALEANAAGTAVLATDTDGFRDSLDLGTTALAVPVNDAEALEQGLLRLVEDAESRERMGTAGRERARAFSWDAIAEKEWEWIADRTPVISRRG